jgi:hypothetical protein
MGGVRFVASPSEQHSTEQSPFDGFPGYDTPHYTQIPDQFFDEHLRFLGGSEAKIMLVLFRQTLGWKKRSESLSLMQIGNRGGLSKRTVQRALPELEAKGLVVVDRGPPQAGDPATTIPVG